MKIRITRRARGDLRDIFNFIASDDREAAVRIRKAILDLIELIGQRPQLGLRNARAPQLRSMLVGRYQYRVHYRMNDGEELIDQIRHTARRPFGDENAS
jgi:toxin ParE1/3/4